MPGCKVFGKLGENSFPILRPGPAALLVLDDPPPDLPIGGRENVVDRARRDIRRAWSNRRRSQSAVGHILPPASGRFAWNCDVWPLLALTFRHGLEPR